MGFGSRAFLAGGLGLTAAFVVACGSSSGGGADLLSHGQSATIAAELSTISDAVSGRDCSQARAGLGELNSTLASLPGTVSQKLVHNLGQGAETTRALALRECRPAATHTSTSASTSATTTSVPTTTSASATQSQTESQTVTQTQTQTQTQSTTGQVGTGGVTSLSNTTTNGGAGLNPGAGN